MTINSSYSPIFYPGAGIAAPLVVTWSFGSPTDIAVSEVDNVTDISIPRTLGVHYTVTQNMEGGVVTPVSAIAVGKTWLIERNTPVTQPDTLRLGGSFSEATVEAMFDRTIRIAQEFSTKIGAGDFLLRGELSSAVGGKGSGLVFPAIEALGAKGNGVDLDDAAFATASALGRTIRLRAGAIYCLSQRLVPVSGARFECDGICTIKVKTGTGGFNSTALNTLKDENAVFFFSGVDDFGIKGVEFILDGTKEVAIWPIRVVGGCTARGCDFERIRFKQLSLLSGGYLSLNSIGDGGYRVRDVEARDCGTAQGPTYWTGTPQITVFEVDNDMTPGVHSKPGYFENVGARNVLLSGAALTAWGQQTDCVNIAGISNGTDRKGAVGYGVFADGVGEVIDLFCTGAVIKGIRARNVHGFGVKLIHGAAFNEIELDYIDGVELAAVAINGGTATSDTQYNTVRVGAVRGVGEVLGTATEACAVLFSEQTGPGRGKNNIVHVDSVLGNGANMKWVVRDGGADIGKNNLVTVGRATGWATASVSAPPNNARVRFRDATRARLTVGTSQSLTSGVAATVQYNTVGVDQHSEANTGTYTIRPKFPGRKLVHAQVRISGANAGDDVTLRIKKNGVSVAQAQSEATSGTTELCFQISQVVYIGEDEVGGVASDLLIEITYTGAAVQVMNTPTMSYFEVVDLG